VQLLASRYQEHGYLAFSKFLSDTITSAAMSQPEAALASVTNMMDAPAPERRTQALTQTAPVS